MEVTIRRARQRHTKQRLAWRGEQLCPCGTEMRDVNVVRGQHLPNWEQGTPMGRATGLVATRPYSFRRTCTAGT